MRTGGQEVFPKYFPKYCKHFRQKVLETLLFFKLIKHFTTGKQKIKPCRLRTSDMEVCNKDNGFLPSMPDCFRHLWERWH